MLPPFKTPPPGKRPVEPEDENETIVLNRRSMPALPQEGRRTMAASHLERVERVDPDDSSETTKLVADDSETTKLIASASDLEDAVTSDEFTRLLRKNLGDISLATPAATTRRMSDRRARTASPSVSEEHTNFRPFPSSPASVRSGALQDDSAPSVSLQTPPTPQTLHVPTAGTPVAPPPTSAVTAFAPLTPERIQAQLDAAREARRMSRVLEPEAPPPDWAAGSPPLAATDFQRRHAQPERGRAFESDPMPMSRSMHASGVRGGGDRSTQPTVSWAFALAAMAIIGSVATVAIVEGSGEDLLRTGAAFVDPSMAAVNKGGGDVPRAQAPKAATPSTQAISVMDLPPAFPVLPLPAPPPPAPDPSPPTYAAPTGLGVAIAAPATEAKRAVAPRPPAAPKADKAVADKADKPTRNAASTGKTGAAAKKGASDEDVANAAAADALARAQLQQSL